MQTGPSFTSSDQSRDRWAPCIQPTTNQRHGTPNPREVRYCGFYCLNIVSRSREPGFSNNVPPALHYLPPLNPKSDEFTNLFRSFLLSNDERKTILELPEADAKVFIEVIDRVCSLDGSWRLFIDFVPEHEGVPSFTTGNRTSKYCLRRSQKVMLQDRAPS